VVLQYLQQKAVIWKAPGGINCEKRTYLKRLLFKVDSKSSVLVQRQEVKKAPPYKEILEKNNIVR
jgi:hypothetical protein